MDCKINMEKVIFDFNGCILTARKINKDINNNALFIIVPYIILSAFSIYAEPQPANAGRQEPRI